MTIVIAPDKFKGSLSAMEVCEAIREGLILTHTDLEIITSPLADGGDGTGDLLTSISQGKLVSVKALDPLYREIESSYGVSSDGETAFIEMAKICGLGLLKKEERNPLHTSTYGMGQLIAHAMERGVRNIILGIGGSATNDAGMGMAAALGFKLIIGSVENKRPTGKDLNDLFSIDDHKIHSLLRKTRFTVLCDVTNPLYGKSGAAFIYGPQKGASDADVELLDKGLLHFEEVAKKSLQVEVNFPGAGAAGGLGAGAKAFLQADMVKGFDFISNFTHLEEKIKTSDLVITGEGKIDDQSNAGKVISGVAALARKYGKPCIAFAGKCELSEEEISSLGIQRVISLTDKNVSEEEAIKNAFTILKKAASTSPIG